MAGSTIVFKSVCSSEPHLGLPSSRYTFFLQYPSRDRLMISDRARYRIVRLDVLESGALQSSVRSDIKRIGLAK